MKIIELTQEQMNQLESRLIPSQRVVANIPTPNIVVQNWNTLFVLKGCVEYGSMDGKDMDQKSIYVEWRNEVRDLPVRALETASVQ